MVSDDAVLPLRTWKEAPAGQDLDAAAIGELRTTDALVVSLDRPDVPSGTVVTSRSILPAGPAAFWSFAEILRRACQVALDIDPQELVMGLQAQVVNGNPSARVFLADALDNGAGYAVELGKPRVFARILDQARQELTAAWEDPAHAHYLHGLLPGLPAVLRQQAAARGAGLATRPRHDGPRGRRAPEDRPLARAGCLQLPMRSRRAHGGWLTAELIDGLPVLINKDARKAVILGHPLWRRDEEHLTDTQRHVLATVTASTGMHAVELSDLYEMDRQPLAVLRHLT